MTSDVSTTKVIEAIRQLVIFTLDTEKYATPISEVREVVKGAEVTPVPGSPPFIVGVVNLRGKIIPVLDLEKLFDLQPSSPPPA
jgi:purine-binding chemotaxis protein CheW